MIKSLLIIYFCNTKVTLAKKCFFVDNCALIFFIMIRCNVVV